MLLDFNEKEKRAKMELSILLMEQIAKLFIMIFMGYAVVKMGLLKDEDSKVLSTLVLYLIYLSRSNVLFPLLCGEPELYGRFCPPFSF